jgi:hypothetical protein
MNEKKLLKNCWFKETKYSFMLDIDPEALKGLTLRNGKYRIEIRRQRNDPSKWVVLENTWEPPPLAPVRLPSQYEVGISSALTPPPAATDASSDNTTEASIDDLPF